ncbi:MAG TPA: TIGR01458 family HAD-type hydrolase [Candidatus Competibacter sp.]|nr:TIGR01458 family HAD-type hydrolase [Candidatus Competibacteraceae bacterium]HRF64201.1 TIGR01458 family HAD-type hydrolase [Candidatus Competibacter sp.]HUM96155.1 TIGR01458 family HAD-type hydrolase [Candidatus Competibacter sp.]
MIHGVLFDLEGVLSIGGYPLPGSREALLSLRAAGIPMRFITNSTRLTRGAIVNRLGCMGLEIEPSHLFSPVVAARNYLISRKLTPHLLVHPNIHSEFADLLGPPPDVVLIGDAGSNFDYGALNHCFRLLLDGLPLLAMGCNRYFRDDGGLNLDLGPFVAALEYAAELEAIILGKPASEFFLAAVNSLELPPQDVVMVGDDAEMDVRGALAAGLRGVLVRTGKYRHGDEAKVEPLGGRVFDDIDAVVDYIL